jgi:hypothetical protein
MANNPKGGKTPKLRAKGSGPSPVLEVGPRKPDENVNDGKKTSQDHKIDKSRPSKPTKTDRRPMVMPMTAMVKRLHRIKIITKDPMLSSDPAQEKRTAATL